MEFPLEFALIIYNIFNIGIKFFRNILELIPSSILQNICSFNLIPFGHHISSTTILSQHEIFDCKGKDDKEKEEFCLLGLKHFSGVN